jgi:hypothetical protein
VRQVRVHLEEVLVVAAEPPAERLHVRAAEAELAGPVHDADLGVALGHLVGELARSVGRRVVHDQDVGVRRGGAHLGHEAHEVRALVVGRRHDQRARLGAHDSVINGGHRKGQARLARNVRRPAAPRGKS